MELIDIGLKIFAAIGGTAGLIMGVKYFVNIRADKKKNNAQADKEQASAQKQEIENAAAILKQGQANLEWVEKKLREIEWYYKESNRKLDGMARHITSLTGIIHQEAFFHCEVMDCTDRKPSLGKYKACIPDCPMNERKINKIEL